MKCKKLLALVMAAVLWVIMLTACGGGGSGVSGSLSTSEITALLKEVDSEASIDPSPKLNDAVTVAAKEMVASGSFSGTKANSMIAKTMGWPELDLLSLKARTGLACVIEEERLERGIGINEIASLLGIRTDKISKLGTVDSPEKFAVAVVLAADESVGKLLSKLSGGNITFDYNVSARKGKDANGDTYWLFAGQATAYLF